MKKWKCYRELGFRWIASLILAIFAVPTLQAQDDSDREAPLERVASLGGRVIHWAEKGNYLYIGQGDSLRVFDQTDRDHPKPVAWVPLDWLSVKLAVSGSKLWVKTIGYNSPRNEKGVDCFDISDPVHPREMKYEEVPEDVEEKFNDDSSLPERITQLTGPLLNAAEVVAGAGRAWVRDEQNGWIMLDTADPAKPKLLGRVGLAKGDRPLALLGSLVYGGGKKPGLRVYKADQPGTVTLHTSVAVNGSVKYLSIAGRNAYIAAGTAGLVTLDISDPAQPRIQGAFPTAFPCTSVVAQGNLAGIHADDLYLLDVSDPAHPRQKSKLWVSDMMTTETTVVEHPLAPGSSLGDWTLGGKSLILQWEYGDMGGNYLQWFDVHNPVAPVSIKTAENEEESYYDRPEVLLAHGELLVAKWYAHNTQLHENYIQLYNLHDPAKPKFLGSYAHFKAIADYAIQGDNIYVADGGNGLIILQLKKESK